MLKILKNAYLNGDEQHSAAVYEDILKKAIADAGGDVWLDQSGNYYELKPLSEMPELIIEPTEESMRLLRNDYLEQYVDPVVTNPLRWSELTTEEQNQYKEYRKYLLDIPQQENFPDIQILSFAEWKTK